MADNTAIKNAAGGTINAATDELGDGSFSPKVTLLLGDSTATNVAPAVSVADDAAFTPGTTRVNPVGFFCDETGTDSVDEGDVGAARMTADRRVYTASSGDVAHDAADSGNPNKVGGKAIAHGTNPTAVAADDRTNWYFNRAGVPFVIGGHPNVITRAHLVADSDGAQTDAALVTVGAGTKIVVTRLTVVCDNANTGDCRVAIGFGTANVPSNALAGVNGLLVDGSFDGGAGVTIGDGSGIIGVGADNEDLRLTCSDPAGGNIRISYSYYTIES